MILRPVFYQQFTLVYSKSTRMSALNLCGLGCRGVQQRKNALKYKFLKAKIRVHLTLYFQSKCAIFDCETVCFHNKRTKMPKFVGHHRIESSGFACLC